MLKIPTVFALIAVSVLAGCASKWSRPGADEATFYQDRYACEQEAARSYPVNMVQVQTSPGYTAPQQPTQTRCTTYGNQTSCTTARAPGADASIYNTAPSYMSQDTNQGSRAQAVQSCLYARGYRQQ